MEQRGRRLRVANHNRKGIRNIFDDSTADADQAPHKTTPLRKQ